MVPGGEAGGVLKGIPRGDERESPQPVVEGIPRTQEGPSEDQATHWVITALSGSQG